MFQKLKIAVKGQKKLMVILLITIFLPSVSLSIFGVIALRNEKFRLEKQIENEQIQQIENLKTHLSESVNEISKQIEFLISQPSIRGKDYPNIKNLLEKQFEDEPLVDQIVVLYENENPFFPLFQAGIDNYGNSPELPYDAFQLNKIRLAEEFEFQQQEYLNAISNYNELFNYSKDKNTKARALNCIVRNYTKLGKYRLALDVNSNIINEYPDIYNSNGLPIILQAKLLEVECYQNLGESEAAITAAMDLYTELLNNKWDLSEGRFYAYVDLTSEILTELFAEEIELKAKYKDEFSQIKEANQLKTGEWFQINRIKSDIIPDLKEIISNNSPQVSPFQFSKTIDGVDYMILAALFPEENSETNTGLLGITLDRIFMESDFFKNDIENIQLLKNTVVCITTLSGKIIIGEETEDEDAIKTTGFWDNNFPPWKIELAYIGSKGSGNINIISSFFFWTIITLIIILGFGTTLIVRIVNREMELLKLKSDFVSSVSHEFKTPLTSMKALTERLETGKVTQPEKMKQYLSLISYDIEKLIRLVRNILTFSKIEEGKKVYKMEITDITLWLKQVIKNYHEQSLENDISIRSHFENDIPDLSIDKDAMTQAIFNLLDNSLKFSPEEKEVEVRIGKNKNSIIIKIKDKGIGIENDESNKIFEKFYRGKNAVKYSIKGTGLGLALVKYTIEAHGGHIKVGREPGWSTVFTINLPINNK